MLVTSIFSFSHIVFKLLLPLGHENMGLFDKGLTPVMCGHAVNLNQNINPLPDDKILDRSKLKQIADDISKCI